MLPTKILKRSRGTVVEVYHEFRSINLFLEGATFSASTIC